MTFSLYGFGSARAWAWASVKGGRGPNNFKAGGVAYLKQLKAWLPK